MLFQIFNVKFSLHINVHWTICLLNIWKDQFSIFAVKVITGLSHNLTSKITYHLTEGAKNRSKSVIQPYICIWVGCIPLWWIFHWPDVPWVPRRWQPQHIDNVNNYNNNNHNNNNDIVVQMLTTVTQSCLRIPKWHDPGKLSLAKKKQINKLNQNSILKS